MSRELIAAQHTDAERRDGTMQLKAFLSELRGRRVYYCPNPGNGGDSLIALGAYRLFDELDIRYQTVEWDEEVDLADEVVIYAGGGNLVGIYPQARTFVQRHHRHAERLILLPCTVRKNEDLLGELGPNVDVICRERYSYDHVREAAPGAHVHVMDDVALSLNARRVLEADAPQLWSVLLKSAFAEVRGSQNADTVALRTLARCLKERVRSGTGWRPPGGRVLHAFRTDREQTGVVLPDDNVDISRLFAFGTHTEAVARYATHAFLAYIDRYEEVRTNRLHVCIGAALLGKEVRFYPNSYFKNEAVYEFSLRDRFPNVRWLG